MTLQNRVTPLGDLVAEPARGLVYGNRGCLHDESGRIRRRFAVRRWIACRTQFRGRRRERLMQPGRFTELFFLDEATAFAAGHRPCAECRRPDYERFVAVWRGLHPRDEGADAIDARLHAERLAPGDGQRRHEAPLDGLPDGAFVLRDGAPWLVFADELLEWTPAGYAARRERPCGETATVVTPPSLVEVLRSGWEPLVPQLHPTAHRRPGARRPLASLLAEARASIARWEPGEALREAESGGLLVDIRSRDARERDGVIPGSLHLPRTVLEWRVDPDSPWRNGHVGDLDRRLILVCDHGYSSSLAAATLVQLGFAHAGDLAGGFEAWRAAGLPVVAAPPEPDERLPGLGPPAGR